MPPKTRAQHQPSLALGASHARRHDHGGDIRGGKRKLARPIDPKRPMHVVFRSDVARGKLSMLHPVNVRRVNATVHALAARYAIRLYRYSNNGDHLHLQIHGKTRKGIQDFLRAIGSKVSIVVTHAKKGQAFGRYWSKLAFTKIIEWGAQFRRVAEYVELNQMEAQLGYLPEYRRKKRRPPVARKS